MNQWLKATLIGLILLPVAGFADWIIYDNGQDWGQVYATAQYDGFGVKFAPNDTGIIMRVKAFTGLHDGKWDGFEVWLYGWNDTLQQPNDDPVETDPFPLGELKGTGEYDGWFMLDFPNQDWTTDDPFVIVLTNKFEAHDVDTIYTDSYEYGETGVFFRLTTDTWSPMDTELNGHNLMVRVWFSGSPVESTSLGSIKAVFK